MFLTFGARSMRRARSNSHLVIAPAPSASTLAVSSMLPML